jgi:hypothetical protein
MTTLAWDGLTLAADRQSTEGGLRRTITKIRRAPNGALIGASGDTVMCEVLRRWYEQGADAEKYPDKDGKATLLVITRGSICVHDGQAIPVRFEMERYAMGSGRDYAETAMYLGKTAREAVEIASLFDSSTGMGIDTLELKV